MPCASEIRERGREREGGRRDCGGKRKPQRDEEGRQREPWRAECEIRDSNMWRRES